LAFHFIAAKLDLTLIDSIEAVFGVFQDGPDDEPLLCRDKVKSQLLGRTLYVYNNGNTLPDDLFVRSRRPVPEFSGADYNIATAYIIGDQVRHTPTTGAVKTLEFWVATAAGTGNNPDDTSAFWTQLDVPIEFAKYLTHASASDWLQGEGQHGKSRLEKIDVEGAEFDLYDLLEGQQEENEFPMSPVQPALN